MKALDSRLRRNDKVRAVVPAEAGFQRFRFQAARNKRMNPRVSGAAIDN